ncbi:MAG: hypothetical protein CMO55_20100 [Verrucomicrobiales bacterium]|nr:hypothetical protein [Verrucomicrobiales bacterium]
MTEPSTIKRELEKAREKLLDLTARNRLLNIPQRPSAKSIVVDDELSTEIFDLLLRQGKKLTFLETEDESDSEVDTDEETVDLLPQPEEEDEEYDERGIAARHRDTRLQTKLKSEVLQRRLLSIYYDARTAIEEQGVNTLFLALGQMKWREDKSSAVDRYAPLLLIPVELERQSAKERFKLVTLDQEPSDNLSLCQKMKEFGITAPDLEFSDDFDLDHYFSRMAEVIEGQEGWEVIPDAIVLGFFSFSKFLMYRDLDPENWPGEKALSEHPLVSGLMGEGFPASEPTLTEEAPLDPAIPVNRLSHVIDADSSQSAAIEEVRAQKNLVIQGPPGTGKSQTITNLIATAVLDGKRVLFVAEKLAALEVVKRRLDAYGLGALALELHSHKSNKRSVLEEIRRTMEQGQPTVQGANGVLEELHELREQLNSHANLLNEPWGAAKHTPIFIIGKLSLAGDGINTEQLPQLLDAASWNKAEVKERREFLETLSPLLGEVGDVPGHSWKGVTRTVLTKIDGEEIHRKTKEATSTMFELRSQASRLAELLYSEEPANLAEVDRLIAMGEQLESAPDFDKAAISNPNWSAQTTKINSIVQGGVRLKEIDSNEAKHFIDSAWDIDLSHIRMQIAAHGKSPLRIINGKYRAALAEFKALLVDATLPKKFDERLQWIDALIEGRKIRQLIRESFDLGVECFGKARWQGCDSEWGSLEEIISWRQNCLNNGVDDRFFDSLSKIDSFEDCVKAARETQQTLTELLNLLTTLRDDLLLVPDEAFGESDIVYVDLELLARKLETWASSPESLFLWVNLQHRVSLSNEKGIGEITDAILDGTLSSQEMLPAFDLGYYRRLYQKLIEEFPHLAHFEGSTHNQLVERFRAADRKRIDFARYEVLSRHHESVSSTAGGMGEVGILKGQMARKRGHMSIRKLLEKAGNATQAIKPVFMMSPMSVAQFLTPGAIEFDLVVFDEASQVEPVDAIGAIARGNQLVVVGDERQLPPTRFFAKMGLDDAEEEEDDIVSAGEIESILGLANAKGLISSMLRWHYRSRHQSLISVSNHEFYDDKLFVVPSPRSADPDLGLKFHFVEDGYFDRGKSRKNFGEARAVADAVILHAKEQPEKTLGVGAFSVAQRDAILDELEIRRRENPEVENFFRSHPTEPFFVKNLENIQGDERDVVFISVGYGKDEAGNRLMNFGPLNNAGGERRLNVLISRAKERCEVFSSIHAEDLDVAGRGHGIKALKTFLQYAESGLLGIPDPDTGRELESPFEEAVYRALINEGYTVHSQVGSAGFFIDLAIVHPDNPGSYVLGLECDGATYHSARSARERDRQRQAVLEGHGWTIHRIWSSDWFTRPQDQLERTILAIEDAMAGNCANALPTVSVSTDIEIDRLPADPIQADVTPSGIPYVEAEYTADTTLDIHEVDTHWMIDLVKYIVEVESPIHRNEIVARVRNAWGVGRAGRRIQEAVSKGIDGALQANLLVAQKDIILFPGKSIQIRDRSNTQSTSLKKIESLPPQEIQSGILQLVKASHSLEIGELAVGVARMLGFKSTSKQLRDLVAHEVSNLVEQQKLAKDGETVRTGE